MTPINVWIVEDDATYRRTLERVLSRADAINSCRAFPSCIEFFTTLDDEPATRPDLILMDLGLPRMGGVEGIKKLSEIAPDIIVVVLTVFSEKGKVLEALEAGAAGYLLKSASGPEIVKGLQEVIKGGSVLSPEIAKVVLDNIQKPVTSEDYKLATREIEVLEKLSLGQSVKEISRSLAISQSTVSTYLARIYAKLEVQSQSGAVAKALRSGIIK
ncbi:DNA-binding response regulator [Saccharobesus litoralis]|uniref:DNA-binding response regulator n=1 Tax=Saccharobesus litoralis TaxID=2172099 RepID=A0A2S0VV80_9ALTE|nr:response regulator transcription factor [Saccharobesus litoralis]AWB68083.1 DNA-binding response regulator [Saccharobesus litoralis]